jgi:serine/threonine protein kinase
MAERERFLKAKEIFLQAAEKDAGERERYLTEACASDEALRQEVLRLLRGDTQANEEWEETMRLQIEEQMKLLQSTEPVDEYLIGDMLGGRYLIESKLGQGGIGAVYLASDTRLYSRPVVVKLLLDTSSRNQRLVDKFKHEGEALARINHPGVVKVYDLGELADGKPYLVMEYVEGEMLASEIQTGGMDFARAALFIRQIAQALSAAHYEGVVHRDLKPANVMIERLADGLEQAKLIDFGIARVDNPLSADATQTPLIMGTPAYMAPEQIEKGATSAASDIYTLGVMAYEMLTGDRPFHIDSAAVSELIRLLEMQREGVRVKPRELRIDLPEAAQGEIEKAISYNIEDRHQTAFEFGERFYRAMTKEDQIEPSRIDLGSLTVSIQSSNLSSDSRGMGAKPVNQAIESFERFWSSAVLTDRIRPLPLESAKQERAQQVRGMGAKLKRAEYTYRLGSQVCLAFDMNREGYLTLLDEGPEGIVYCLCPSWFAPSARLEARRFYLPQKGSPYEAFELTGAAGKEKLLAIISDEPLELNWMSKDADTPARELSEDDIEALFARLEALGEGRWTALASYFEVIA